MYFHAMNPTSSDVYQIDLGEEKFLDSKVSASFWFVWNVSGFKSVDWQKSAVTVCSFIFKRRD